MRNKLAIFSKLYDEKSCHILHHRVARYSFFFSIYFRKKDVRDIKIGNAPYFVPRNLSVIFLNFCDQQGCQISHHRVARYLVFSIYFHKNGVRDIKMDKTPYFEPRSRLVIYYTPFAQTGLLDFASQGCQIQIFSFSPCISIKTMSEISKLVMLHISAREINWQYF